MRPVSRNEGVDVLVHIEIEGEVPHGAEGGTVHRCTRLCLSCHCGFHVPEVRQAEAAQRGMRRTKKVVVSRCRESRHSAGKSERENSVLILEGLHGSSCKHAALMTIGKSISGPGVTLDRDRPGP